MNKYIKHCPVCANTLTCKDNNHAECSECGISFIVYSADKSGKGVIICPERN